MRDVGFSQIKCGMHKRGTMISVKPPLCGFKLLELENSWAVIGLKWHLRVWGVEKSSSLASTEWSRVGTRWKSYYVLYTAVCFDSNVGLRYLISLEHAWKYRLYLVENFVVSEEGVMCKGRFSCTRLRWGYRPTLLNRGPQKEGGGPPWVGR